MGVLDVIRTAAGPVVESAEGVERQTDDTPGGGAVDETDVFSPSLFAQSLSFGLVSEDAATDAGLPVETDVHELGEAATYGTGAADDAFGAFAGAVESFGAGLRGDDADGLGALGRFVRWVTRNPSIVLGGLLLLYLAPLLTQVTSVVAEVADDD